MDKKKLLVCFHVYYQEQIPYFLSKMKNIHGCEWDLVVTYSELSPENRELITTFKPDAMFIEAENTGYDIWPFIKALKNVHLDDYSYLMKIHTKNCDAKTEHVNMIRLRGTDWRNMLVDALLKNRKQFKKALSILEKNKMAGMVCNAALIRNVIGFRPWGLGVVSKEMERIGLDIKLRDKHMIYCAGTMFLARVAPYRFIVKADITPETFSDTSTCHADNKMAHCYERILGFAVLADNYRIKGLWTGKVKKTKKIAHDVSSPLIQWIFSINYDSKGRKCVTIFGFKIPLKSREKHVIG